jgi:hypothetical protein
MATSSSNLTGQQAKELCNALLDAFPNRNEFTQMLRFGCNVHLDAIAGEDEAFLRIASAPAIPAPPDFYAEPPYIVSNAFVGRQAQLDTLTDWAAPADPHPLLLFEAIGGTGKSMLTWEWTTKHSTEVRQDWAGRFWYSFYERGAIMADFCQRSLAYITQRPIEDFRKQKTLTSISVPTCSSSMAWSACWWLTTVSMPRNSRTIR